MRHTNLCFLKFVLIQPLSFGLQKCRASPLTLTFLLLLLFCLFVYFLLLFFFSCPSQAIQAVSTWQKLQLYYYGILENGGKSPLLLRDQILRRYNLHHFSWSVSIRHGLNFFSVPFPSPCSDKRTDSWPLVHSPVPISCIFLCYLAVIWLGPKVMARREPLNLRAVLIVYNFLMVGLSAYMFYEVLLVLTYQPFTLRLSVFFFFFFIC